jgi:hypothetical protein
VLAGIATVLFLLRGSMFVYSLRSGQSPTTPSMWLRARLDSTPLSAGAWAVAVGVGVVLIVGGGLVSVAHPHRDAWHYAGGVLFGMTAWTLGLMRQARQNSQPEQ